MMMRAASLGVIIVMAGCDGMVGNGSLCASASRHISQCTGGKAHVDPNVCTEEAAAALLELPCEALRSRSAQFNVGDLFGGLFGGTGGMGGGYGNDCYCSPQTGQCVGNCNGGYNGGCGGGGNEWCGLLGDLLGTVCKVVTGGSHDDCYDNANQHGFDGNQDCYCNPQTGKCVGNGCNSNGNGGCYCNPQTGQCLGNCGSDFPGGSGFPGGTGSCQCDPQTGQCFGNCDNAGDPDMSGFDSNWGNGGGFDSGWGNGGTGDSGACAGACQVAMTCTKFFSSASICQQRLCPSSDNNALAALASASNCSQAFSAFMALIGK